VQRAREILNSPEFQPAQTFPAEVERFLKHKVDTNRYSKMSAESKRSCLTMFADSVKNVVRRRISASSPHSSDAVTKCCFGLAKTHKSLAAKEKRWCAVEGSNL
jgi:hypothetical protein